ncbi:hypothetical protein JGU71_26860 [Antrihabitans sp. YC3-6]|uniref:Uncharacterized protein n=1 Tax=Antrihabitans stalagmiti TaxID=2799499 RepID=A0A934NW62_9NOCA|nr:hypothetical protein [Antrihabitans stalagmiti]
MDPPEEAYGRVTNPQRFAPLVPAATTLAADLERRYDVTVSRGPAKQWSSSTVIPLETIRIRPVRPDQAPLTITVTSFPGLYLTVGAWQHIALPSCGCDACDEDADDGLRELERYVEALTSGQLSERITGTVQLRLEHSWKAEAWSRSGRGVLSRSRAMELRAKPVQPPPDGQWRPWTPRI